MNKKKILIAVAALLLVCALTVVGTLAYITAVGHVTNTFTVGKINISIEEPDDDGDGDTSANEYVMIPGHKIAKAPKITVAAKSENAWLFVVLDKSDNFDTFLTANVRTGSGEWTKLTGYDNVWYRSYTSSDSEQTYYVLEAGTNDYANGFVTVKNVDMATIEAMESDPTLDVYTGAIQKDDTLNTAAAAFTALCTAESDLAAVAVTSSN